MRILALDIATNTGWAFADGEAAPRFGVVNLPKTGEDLGRYGFAFHMWLADAITKLAPQLIVYEAPILAGLSTNITTLRKLYGLGMMAETVAHAREVPCKEENLGKIRTHFLGRGRVPRKSDDIKRAVVAECQRRGWAVTDHNAADALALLDLARALTIEGWAIKSAPLFEGRAA